MPHSSAGAKLKAPVLAVVLALQACVQEPPAPASGETSSLVQPENWWEALPRPGYAALEKVGVFDDWFEVYALGEGTYAIYEPYQFQEALSYLVLGADRAALVDSGNGIGRIERVVEALTKLPVIVLLTHEHFDHYGGGHAFEEVAVFDHPRAIASLSGGVPNERARTFVEGDEVWHALPQGVDAETFSVLGVQPRRLLHDGERIDLGGRTLEVIATPGHSPGSVSYLDSGNRLLFTGDHFYPGPLYAFGDDVDLDAYVASNDRLVARLSEYDYVLSGHNEPWIEAAVLPRVSAAFRTIAAGGGEFEEQDELRRFRFEGFDIIVRAPKETDQEKKN
jgi:glyoxylase-like metal-dependent hydrolase (beta-lactamase superfamily II)